MKWMPPLAAVMTFFIFLSPSTVSASYLIQLKSGKSFVTNQYWEENGQLKFNISGGIIGVDKTTVDKITGSELPYIQTAPEAPTPAVQPESDLSDQAETMPLPQADSTPKGLSPEEKEAVLSEKNALFEKFKAAEQDFNKAKERGSRADIERERKNLLNIRKQLDQLRKNAADRSGGKIPDWWVDSVSFDVLQE